MPSSGARSGTKPSRSERGAGSGKVGAVLLACGHEAHGGPAVSHPSNRDGHLWTCPTCLTLQRRQR